MADDATVWHRCKHRGVSLTKSKHHGAMHKELAVCLMQSHKVRVNGLIYVLRSHRPHAIVYTMTIPKCLCCDVECAHVVGCIRWVFDVVAGCDDDSRECVLCAHW